MSIKKIKNLICGNSVAALVCGERLIAAGEEVLVLSPSNFIGGHFGGIEIDDVHYDIGMNFLEFSAYRNEPDAHIESYDPKIKNDSGRFVSHIRKYIEKELGVKIVKTATPKMYIEGKWYEDFIISDRFESLTKLHLSLQKRLAEDFRKLKTPEELHAANKNSSQAFIEADLEKVSRANHGNVFHEEFIEPLCRKITNLPSKRLMAYYHRLAWLPVFYPETIQSYFSKNPQPVLKVNFYYPASGNSAEPINVLAHRIRRSTALEISPIAVNGIKFWDSVVITLENGDEIRPENFVWASDWTKLARATGVTTQPFNAANITCAFFEIESSDMIEKFSTAFILDSKTPCYRITQFDYCAGKNSETNRICMEFNTDNLSCDNTPENFFEILVDLKIVRRGVSPKKGNLKHFKRALILPTPKNYQKYENLEKLFANKIHANLSIGGAGGFSSTSFNDQIIQGIKAANSILEGL